MLARTRRCGNSPPSWNTIDVPRSLGGTRVTSRPRSSIVPASSTSSPAIARSKVVLPHPLGPSRVRISPGLTSTSTPSRAARSRRTRRAPDAKHGGRWCHGGPAPRVDISLTGRSGSRSRLRRSRAPSSGRRCSGLPSGQASSNSCQRLRTLVAGERVPRRDEREHENGAWKAPSSGVPASGACSVRANGQVAEHLDDPLDHGRLERAVHDLRRSPALGLRVHADAGAAGRHAGLQALPDAERAGWSTRRSP